MVETETKIQRYESYKDSGVAWLKEIPEHWELIRFKFLAKANKGKLPSKIVSLNEGYLPPYMSMEYLRGGEENQWVKDKDVIVIDKDEILLLWDGSNSGEFIKSRKGVISSTVAHIVFKNIDEKFAWFYSKVLELELRKNTVGMGIPHVNGKVLNNLLISLPPLPEQTAIAQFLDEKTTKIDEAIAIKQQQIALLKERKQILIHKAVTRGLDDSVPLKDSGVEWIGEIPEHWEVKALKFICYLQSGEFISSDDFKEEGYPVYGGNGFRAYTETFTNEGFYALIGRQGALCGNVNYAKGKFYATEHAVVVYPLNKEDTLWLGETIRVADFNRLSQSAAQPGIAVGVIKNERFPYPPLSEQKEIANYIETASAKIETAISLKEQEISKLQEYKSSLINSVVTGKVRVC